MNKEAYMNSLRAGLQGFEEDLVQEIVADYEERFCIGAAQGKTEEQVIAELGDVEGLVEELSELQGLSGKEQSIGNKNQADGTDNTSDAGRQQYRGTYTQEKSFAESLDGFVKKLGRVVDDAMKEAGVAIENAMEQVEIHVEEAKRRRAAGEDVDFDIHVNINGNEKESGKEPNVEQRGAGDETCRKIVLDTGIADVKMRRTAGSIPEAECRYYSHKTAMAYPFYAYQEGDTFYVGIRKEQQEKKSGYFQFSWSPSIEIMLGVPDGVQLITAASASGDLTVEELATEEIKVRSGSGDITVSYFAGGQCHLESASGDITLEKSKQAQAEVISRSGDITASKLETGKLSISTASGDIDADGIVAEYARFDSMSGDQSIDDVETQEMHVGTASGDLDITDCRGGRLAVTTASGDVCVSGDFKKYHVNSQSGDVELTSRHDADITAKSASGEIEIGITETKGCYDVTTHSVSGECTVSGQWKGKDVAAGEYVYVLEGKSISGDVTIQFR